MAREEAALLRVSPDVESREMLRSWRCPRLGASPEALGLVER
jgi:hypothetical protein